MTYDWNEISQKWLLGTRVNYPREQCETAFNTVERLLESGWIDRYSKGARGIAIAIPIIELGRVLGLIENVPFAGSIISRMNNLDLYPPAWSEAQFLSRLVEIGVDVRILVSQHTKHPDFEVSGHGLSVFVEVSQPEWSNEWRKTMRELTLTSQDILEITPNGTRIEGHLRRNPTAGDRLLIVEAIKHMMSRDDTQYRIDELVELFLSHTNIGQMAAIENGPQETGPVIGMGNLKKDGGPPRSVVLKVPFTDKRAEQMLRRESKHFSKTSSNLLVLDLTIVPGGIKTWESLISRRLQVNLNRRIGAVLLINYWISTKGLDREEKLMMHPNPYVPLPDYFISRIQNASRAHVPTRNTENRRGRVPRTHQHPFMP